MENSDSDNEPIEIIDNNKNSSYLDIDAINAYLDYESDSTNDYNSNEEDDNDNQPENEYNTKEDNQKSNALSILLIKLKIDDLLADLSLKQNNKKEKNNESGINYIIIIR